MFPSTSFLCLMFVGGVLRERETPTVTTYELLACSLNSACRAGIFVSENTEAACHQHHRTVLTTIVAVARQQRTRGMTRFNRQ